MNIRNATIAMRKRKIGLFEQERLAVLDDGQLRYAHTPAKSHHHDKKKNSVLPKQQAWASWQEH